MAERPENEVSCHERVKCSCGAEVLQKNLKQHEKTKKHQNGGVVVRETGKVKVPAQVAVAETCLGTKKYTELPRAAPPKKEAKDEEETDGEGEEGDDEFEDIVLDDIKTINDKMDHIIELINAGFSALLGGEMDTIEEGEECEETKAPAKG